MFANITKYVVADTWQGVVLQLVLSSLSTTWKFC